jgi:predicted nucleotide-binding protein
MLDQTIGVLESGYFEQRRSILKKTRGPLGSISGRKIFLVHGHDKMAFEATARFIEKLDLDAVVLHEQPNVGQTIIEKVETCSEVSFAVVLLTPDDVGAKKGNEDQLRPRARQNVILELGYFLARLGRNRVAALVRGELEKPSDYDGVVYISMDEAGAWKMLLAREIKAAGLNVDLNDAM